MVGRPPYEDPEEYYSEGELDPLTPGEQAELDAWREQVKTAVAELSSSTPPPCPPRVVVIDAATMSIVRDLRGHDANGKSVLRSPQAVAMAPTGEVLVTDMETNQVLAFPSVSDDTSVRVVVNFAPDGPDGAYNNKYLGDLASCTLASGVRPLLTSFITDYLYFFILLFSL
jgi:hypothetical protein